MLPHITEEQITRPLPYERQETHNPEAVLPTPYYGVIKFFLKKWAKVTKGFSIEAKILDNQRGENERRDICKSAD
jgi:hypothetical protein